MAKTTDLYFSVFETGMSEIKVPSDSVPGRGTLPDLQMAIFSLHYSHDGQQREKQLSNAASHKGANPITRVLSS